MIPSNVYKDITKLFDELDIDVVDFIPNILGSRGMSFGCRNPDFK